MIHWTKYLLFIPWNKVNLLTKELLEIKRHKSSVKKAQDMNGQFRKFMQVALKVAKPTTLIQKRKASNIIFRSHFLLC